MFFEIETEILDISYTLKNVRYNTINVNDKSLDGAIEILSQLPTLSSSLFPTLNV